MKNTHISPNSVALPQRKEPLLKEQGNIRIEQLYPIIINENGKPDLLAIDIYLEARSWFKPKRDKTDTSNVIYISKLKGYGWRTNYEYFRKKYKCTSETIRVKLVKLEELGLLKRDFRTEYFKGKRYNNILYLLVWKDTPHFYSEIGIDTTLNSDTDKLSPTSRNQKIPKVEHTPPIQKNLVIIKGNTNNKASKIDLLLNSNKVLEFKPKNYPTIRKKFIEFYPLESKDVTELQTMSSRGFNAHFMNQLLTKFSKKYPDNDFPSKQAFLKYFSDSLKGELRTEAKANNEEFIIMSMEEYRINKFLQETENKSISKPCAENVLKTKIASTLEPIDAYKLLCVSTINIEENKKEVRISTRALLPIPDYQQKIILQQIGAMGFNKFKLVLKPIKTKEQLKQGLESEELEIKLPNNVWGEIRKSLISYYGKPIDISWFSKLEANISEESKVIELKAPNKFVRDWIEREYFNDLESIGTSMGFGISLAFYIP